jgi:hypothetical protein
MGVKAPSRTRLPWNQLPDAIRRHVEQIAGDRVIASENCSGAFSPGLASRLTLANRQRAFAKAINGDWPGEAEVHRREADIAAHLSAGVPAARLHGAFDDGRLDRPGLR